MKGYVIAASVAAAAVVAAIVYLFMFGSLAAMVPITGDNDSTTSITSNDASGDSTNVASPSQAPTMLLIVLQGNEDASQAVAQYGANNTEPIQLASNAHIRFDSPDQRTAESFRATARDLDNGAIQLLRKSYDVNNEFFVNLDRGHYEFHVQASWFETGTFVYEFNVAVT
jgi:hypothetical protein